jgi:hypothetical protein
MPSPSFVITIIPLVGVFYCSSRAMANLSELGKQRRAEGYSRARLNSRDNFTRAGRRYRTLSVCFVVAYMGTVLVELVLSLIGPR